MIAASVDRFVAARPAAQARSAQRVATKPAFAARNSKGVVSVAVPFAVAKRAAASTRCAAVASASVADLAKHFNKAGSVTVQAGQGGLPMVVMKGADGAVAEAYLFGGVVTSWKTGGRDVLYVRPDAKFDKSKPISGGVPHCWPQFGPGAMQLHGFARNMDWELTAATGGAAPSIEMTLVDSEATRAMWPAKFKVTQTITLSTGKLTATLTVHNTDSKPFEFTSSFHTYFSVKALPEVTVEGLNGLKMLDRVAKPPAEGKCSGAVTIKGPVDSVYYGAPSSVTLNVGKGSTVKIDNKGWPDAVVWNPWTDMKACYEEFVCVENAAVAKPVSVAPGAVWSGSMELTAH